MSVETIRTYVVHITREADDPEQEVHVKRLIVARDDDARADEGFMKTLFLYEMEIAWDQLHRFIRRMEVGEE